MFLTIFPLVRENASESVRERTKENETVSECLRLFYAICKRVDNYLIITCVKNRRECAWYQHFFLTEQYTKSTAIQIEMIRNSSEEALSLSLSCKSSIHPVFSRLTFVHSLLSCRDNSHPQKLNSLHEAFDALRYVRISINRQRNRRCE